MQEHKNDINKQKELSQVYKHVRDFHHEFSFDRVQLLQTEITQKKRKMLESFYTTNNVNSINRALDTPTYLKPIVKECLS